MQLSTSETLFLVKPSSLFITLVYSLTSITAEQFGEIVNNGLSEKLQKVQNRAARIITTSNYDASLDELFQSFNWHKLELLRKFNLSILLYKALNNETAENLSSKFINRMDLSLITLRNRVNKLTVPLPHTENFKKSFSYSAAVLLNS